MTVETRVPETRAPAEIRQKTTADVLRHAAMLIEEVGWWHGRDSAGDGRCAGLAMDAAAGHDNELSWGAHRALLDHLGIPNPSGDLEPVYIWNDTRTAAEVCAALRAAADAA